MSENSPYDSDLVEELNRLVLNADTDGLIRFFDQAEQTRSLLPIPLVSTLLDDTDDLELKDQILSYLINNMGLVEEDVLKTYRESDDTLSKANLLGVIVQRPSAPSFWLLVSEYIREPQFRSYLLQTAFEDRELLLLTLAGFLETESLSDTELEAVQGLLTYVDRKTFLKHSHKLRHLKIGDLYYKGLPPTADQ